MGIDLRHLPSFVAVAEMRSFGHAAKRLHLTQPALSRQIRRLEADLDVELFDRKARPIRLTPAGRTLLEETRRGLKQLESAAERARHVARGAPAHLLIGALPWGYDGIVPSIVRTFVRDHPDVRIEFSVAASAQQANSLREGRLDVGFADFVKWPTETHKLAVELLAEDPLVAILPDDHPLAAKVAVSFGDLAGEPFVALARAVAPGLFGMQAGEFSSRGLQWSVIQEAPDAHSLLAFIAAGIGVGLHFQSLANVQRRGVSFVPLVESDRAGVAPTWILSRADESREIIRAFRDCAHAAASGGGDRVERATATARGNPRELGSA